MGFPSKQAEHDYNVAYYKRNKAQVKSVNAKWYKSNPEKTRYITLKHKYGITKEQYLLLLEVQGHRCAICRREPSVNRNGYLDVDHDHATDQVRGLLCNRCNLMLANAVDDPDILSCGIEYLRKAKSKSASPQSTH